MRRLLLPDSRKLHKNRALDIKPLFFRLLGWALDKTMYMVLSLRIIVVLVTFYRDWKEEGLLRIPFRLSQMPL
jgi:hypothetical protein